MEMFCGRLCLIRACYFQFDIETQLRTHFQYVLMASFLWWTKSHRLGPTLETPINIVIVFFVPKKRSTKKKLRRITEIGSRQHSLMRWNIALKRERTKLKMTTTLTSFINSAVSVWMGKHTSIWWVAGSHRGNCLTGKLPFLQRVLLILIWTLAAVYHTGHKI